ncbi:MAG: hypothetical protein AAF802_31470, partial [Planctomycetota bacterium]
MTRVRYLIACCCLTVLSVPLVQAETYGAHPVSVTQTYAYVTRESLDVSMEVFLEDLFLFHDLKPNDQDFLEPDVLQAGVEKHRQFLLDRFRVRDLSGERLQGQIVEVEKLDLPREGVALGELMAHTLNFQLRFEMPVAPEFLTVSQHFTDAEGLIPSEMNLVMKQENAGEAYTNTLKPDEPVTVRFNWNLPPLSAEASEEERKRWAAKQKEEALGITSYSSVYSFLYIDDFEVRHEILIPLLTLEESVLVARDEDEFLDLDEQAAARQQIEAFFKTGNPISINGVDVSPIVERCDFYGLDFKDFAKRSEPKRVSLASARVGIILSYALADSPNTVDLLWNRFNNYLWSVNMVVFAFDEVAKVTLSRLGSSNAYHWDNPGRPDLPPLETVSATLPSQPKFSLPVVTAACIVLMLLPLFAAGSGLVNRRGVIVTLIGLTLVAAFSWPFFRLDVPNPLRGPPILTAAETDSVFLALHENIYRAFDYRDEEDVYDALAKSIDGELLEDVFLQIRRGLEMQEQGGAVSRIREVDVLERERQQLSQSDRNANSTSESHRLRYRGRWNVAGTVEHWGHIHARTNQYEAIFDIEST